MVMYEATSAALLPLQVKLLYNRKAGPIAGIQVPEDQTLTLRYGFNGWQRPVVVQMQRDATAASKVEASSPAAVEEDWWSADVEVPLEAAALNFVVNYYDHYDNNDRQDHKINVSGGRGGLAGYCWARAAGDL